MDLAASGLLVERRGTVDWVTLSRPERLNSLDGPLTTALRTYFQGLAEDPVCRIVVLRGAGRAFCAGLDLKSGQASDFLNGGVDVALLDFNMPGRDGLALAAEIRALHPGMPLAVITANVQDEVVMRARAVGAAFVSKPLTEDGLRGFLSGAALQLRAAH